MHLLADPWIRNKVRYSPADRSGAYKSSCRPTSSLFAWVQAAQPSFFFFSKELWPGWSMSVLDGFFNSSFDFSSWKSRRTLIPHTWDLTMASKPGRLSHLQPLPPKNAKIETNAGTTSSGLDSSGLWEEGSVSDMDSSMMSVSDLNSIGFDAGSVDWSAGDGPRTSVSCPRAKTTEKAMIIRLVPVIRRCTTATQGFPWPSI